MATKPKPKTEEVVTHEEYKLKILKQPEKEYRVNSARALYWARFNQFNDKLLSELEKDCETNPPSTPKKGTHAGKVEPFGGWVSFFKQQGFISLTLVKK